MGGFPSGQRGQTVNLLSTTSVVRIHHLPPKKRVQICALFCFARKPKAFLPEEGGTAQAVTEGAAHEQVCIRANLMRILPICKTPSVFACGKSSSLEEGACPLCRCATSLPEGETSWSVRKSKKFAPSPLNSDISRAAPDTPRGRRRRSRRTAGTACAHTAGKHPQVQRKTARAAQRHTRRRSAC